jgi:hypothetical protein
MSLLSRVLVWQLIIGVLMALAGASLLGWGATVNQPWLTALGGALFGASVEKLLTLLANKDFGDSVLDLLAKGLHATARSNEADTRPLRRMLYFYHPTSVQGELAWRCDKLDFSHDVSPGGLTAVCEVGTKADPKPLRFTVTALVRGKRVVLIRQPENRFENPSIAVLPHLAEYHRYDSGIVFKQTWDGVHVASPCILSLQPLAKSSKGFVDPADYDTLQQIWTTQFSDLNKGCQVTFGWR